MWRWHEERSQAASQRQPSQKRRGAYAQTLFIILGSLTHRRVRLSLRSEGVQVTGTGVEMLFFRRGTIPDGPDDLS